MKLTPHKSLTAYLKQMKTGEKFDEMTTVKICNYCQYKSVEESYIGKKEKRIEYTKAAHRSQWAS